MATIVVNGDNLVIRGFVRSRRIPMEMIRAIEPIEERNMYGMAGRTLGLRLVDGSRITAGEFWSRVDRSGKAPRIDAIARELSKLLQPRFPSPGPDLVD